MGLWGSKQAVATANRRETENKNQQSAHRVARHDSSSYYKVTASKSARSSTAADVTIGMARNKVSGDRGGSSGIQII